MNIIHRIRSNFHQRGKKTKILLLILAAGILLFAFSLPRRLFHDPLSFVIEDSDGNLLNAAIASDGQWRFPSRNRVPDKFVACITTFEDRRFFDHPGVDLRALGRAILNNAGAGSIRQGGSTLTMQVIRLSRKNQSRTIFNKMTEAWLALRLEMSYSKSEILSLYASHAPFGSNVVGLDAAAWRYFGRSPDKLSWADMAALAVLPNAPSLVHPGKNRQLLKDKRDRLLDKLYAFHYISRQDAALAKMEPLPDKPQPLPQLAPHLLQRFRKEFTEIGSGPRLTTTIHGNLQKSVNTILEKNHSLLKANGINNLCALVLEVETGNTLAYCGNIYDPSNKDLESDVDVIHSPRSPGSALKPLLYAAALSDGLILPDALLPDIPTDIAGYTPKNFDLGYDGAVPASNALSRSLNVPAVHLLRQYKYARFHEWLIQAGIGTLNRPADFYGLSLVLGGCEVTPWDLAGVYASLARVLKHDARNKGNTDPADFHPPSYVPGKNEKKEGSFMPTVDAASIYFSFKAMQEVMRPGDEGLWELFGSSRRIAWKTGTSFGFRDGWSIGVTPDYVVAVWAGNTDGEGRPDLVGIKTAAPVMFDIFRLLPATGWFSKPSTRYSYIPVCRRSGFRAGIDCPDTDTLYMPPQASRSPQCPYHRVIHLDKSGQFQVNESCASPMDMVRQSWFVLPPTMEFFYKRTSPDFAPLPPFLPGCNSLETGRMMELIYPRPNARIFVPVELQGEKGRTVFKATHRNNQAVIFWSIDDQYVGKTDRNHQLALDPSPGRHRITLTDQDGNMISSSFEILEK